MCSCFPELEHCIFAAAFAKEAWRITQLITHHATQPRTTVCNCRYGDAAALARLLQRGCPVDAADYDGRTLLHVAVTNKQQVRG